MSQTLFFISTTSEKKLLILHWVTLIFMKKKKMEIKAKLSALLETKNFLEFDQLFSKVESLQNMKSVYLFILEIYLREKKFKIFKFT